MPAIDIMPHHVHVFGFEMGASVMMGWIVLVLLIALLIFFRTRIQRFTDKPGRLQNLLELIVESVYKFAKGKVGHNADWIAPIVLTLMTYVAGTTLVELFGFPPATEDLSCTLGLGLITFTLVNFTALKELGLIQRIKHMAQPNVAVLPIRMLTDVLTPFTLAIRLFANVLVGGIIMKLIYFALPIVLPAIFSSYFTMLHIAIQTFVFGLLTLSYIGEAIE